MKFSMRGIFVEVVMRVRSLILSIVGLYVYLCFFSDES